MNPSSAIAPLPFARKSPLVLAWVAFAVYAALAAALIQFVILPHVIPALHAGHGLIKDGDSIGYHQIAASMAAEIDRVGWRAWSPAPEGHIAAGLAAPFYVLITPEPWSLIPVNAMLHATAGVIVMYLLRLLGATTGIAFAGASLWVGFPSTMQWVSQIQKDCYFQVGMLCAMLGWVQLWRATRRECPPRAMINAILLIAAGVLLTGMARTVGFELLQAGGIIFACVAMPSLVRNWWSGKTGGLRFAVSTAVFLLLPAALAHTPRDHRMDHNIVLTAETGGMHGEETGGTHGDRVKILCCIEYWDRTPILPASIDRALLRLIVARSGYGGASYANAGSHIDLDVKIRNALDFAAYLPRAVQVGFLGPFPAHWIAPGASPGGTLMRIAAGIEMTIVYAVLLLGLPLAIWRWRGRVELWMCILFCSALVTVFAYATPNLGTLYRLRYGFEMTLAAVGFAGLGMAIRDARSRRHLRQST
jgi:hypothetical protein